MKMDDSLVCLCKYDDIIFAQLLMSAYFCGSARPNGVNDLSGRGPHRLYIYPGRRTFTLPHQKVFFWPLVNDFLQDFGIILPFLVFLCINLTFQVFF